jgi:Putative auto-transporter adhesin, head GIN domain
MRSKLIGFTACLTALNLLTGCFFNIGGSGIRGSGVFKTQSRPVAGFSSIFFKSEGKVIVNQTGKESLTIRAEDNILPLLESTVTNRVLYLGTVNNTDIDPTKTIEFVLEVKTLEGLNIDGVSSVEAKNIQSKQLAVSLRGVGNVTISGKANVLDLDLSGVGSYEGAAFKTKQTVVRSRGVGSAVINASEQLDADLSGIGSVEYIGSPQVQRSGQGLGSVKKR